MQFDRKNGNDRLMWMGRRNPVQATATRGLIRRDLTLEQRVLDHRRRLAKIEAMDAFVAAAKDDLDARGAAAGPPSKRHARERKQSAQTLVNSLMRSEVLAKHLLLCHMCGRRFTAGDAIAEHLADCEADTLALLTRHELPAAQLAATPDCALPVGLDDSSMAEGIAADVASYNKAAVRSFLRSLLTVDDRRVCIHALDDAVDEESPAR
jgi:hypothetical protein